MDINEKLFINRLFFSLGALLTIISFFSPWLNLVTLDKAISLRGFQLGFLSIFIESNASKYDFMIKFIQFSPLLLAGLAMLLLNGNIFQSTLHYSILGLGSLSLFYLIDLKIYLPSIEGLSLNWGIMGTFIGIAAIVCGSAYTIRDLRGL